MIELQVEGMSCGGCVRSVTNLVQGVDPEAKVDVDLATKKVRVDTGADAASITSVLVDAGYPARVSAPG